MKFDWTYYFFIFLYFFCQQPRPATRNTTAQIPPRKSLSTTLINYCTAPIPSMLELLRCCPKAKEDLHDGEGRWHASQKLRLRPKNFTLKVYKMQKPFGEGSQHVRPAIMTPRAEAHCTVVHRSQGDTIQYWGPYSKPNFARNYIF